MIATAEIPLSDSEFRDLSELLYKTCGIALHDGKKDLVRARLSKRMRSLGIPTVSAYLRRCLDDATGQEMTMLIDQLSTNLTSFFRERAHFDFLTDRFIPSLFEKKENDRRIRVWSAGCSSGEEPYSLAITLLECLKGRGDWDVKILATDISTRVLRTAMDGAYAADRVASVPEPLRRTYFTTPPRGAEPPRYQVAAAVRRLIQFRHLNLMTPWPFTGPFDFIFCRNVMIYFDKPTQQTLVGRYCDCLDRGGLLFTGHSESLAGITHRFRYVAPTIYVKP